MSAPNKLITCLMFDDQAEEAAKFYTSIFPNSAITHTARVPPTGENEGGSDSERPTGGRAGAVITVSFSLDGRPFLALNGGSHCAPFSASTSIQIMVDTQDELDRYWAALGEGGDVAKQQCGWVFDRFGFPWQVVPRKMPEFLGGADRAAAGRAFKAMMGMKKLDIAELNRAYKGEGEKAEEEK